jgi:hypothetical protein
MRGGGIIRALKEPKKVDVVVKVVKINEAEDKKNPTSGTRYGMAHFWAPWPTHLCNHICVELTEIYGKGYSIFSIIGLANGVRIEG